MEQRGKLVGVSITYRLGLLGFLGGSLLATDGDLNVGLQDQRAALEWIQRHISKFGGDPNDVTIYGESAGGASMVMQVTAYGGQSFFNLLNFIEQQSFLRYKTGSFQACGGTIDRLWPYANRSRGGVSVS